MYADYEENFGLLNHAMAIYDRACTDLGNIKDKYEVFNLYLAKAAEFYGVGRTR
jgi:pre-mRNA-splicing factor SYF1